MQVCDLRETSSFCHSPKTKHKLPPGSPTRSLTSYGDPSPSLAWKPAGHRAAAGNALPPLQPSAPQDGHCSRDVIHFPGTKWSDVASSAQAELMDCGCRREGFLSETLRHTRETPPARRADGGTRPAQQTHLIEPSTQTRVDSNSNLETTRCNPSDTTCWEHKSHG